MPDAEVTPDAVTGRTPKAWAGIAHAVVDAVGDKVSARKRDHLAGVLEEIERDLVPVLLPWFAEHAHDPDLPEPVRELAKMLTEPEHFAQSILLGIAVGATLYPVIGTMTAPAVRDIANAVWSAAPREPLTPSELAAAELKGIRTPFNKFAEARKSGMDDDRFAALVEIAGNAIGIQEALLLWRRGQIDDAGLLSVMRYSNLNPKFYEMVRDLRYTPPGTGTIITGALKGHLPDADARDRIAQAGTNPDNYEWLLASAGRPPGIMQMVGLWNRGYTTEDRVHQAVRQSDINNEYWPEVQALRWYHVPPRSIVPMLRSGGINEARARELLTEHGVRPEDQDAFIAEAHTTRAAADKTLTGTQVIAAYDEHLIARDIAKSRLVSLHYHDADAELLLDIADSRVRDRAVSSALTRLRTLYVTYRATKSETAADLSRLQIPQPDQSALFSVWDHERDANAPDLTVAQWQGALRREVIRPDQFVSAMQARGYNAFQINVLAEEAFPPPRPPAAAHEKNLTPTQILKLYTAGTINQADTVSRLVALGYSPQEAAELITLATAPPPTTGV